MKIPRPEPRLRSRRTYSFDVIPRERSDIIHRSQLDIRIDKQAIIETACDHNRYVVRGTTLRNLPIYDDCRMYDVAPEKYASLLEKEVLKLIAFAESKDFPAFSSQGSLGGVGRADFESLSGLADQMSCNLSVLTQDNSRHGLEVPAVASEAWDALIKSRQHLRARYAQDTSGVEGRQPATLPNPQDNKIAYHSLLDYIIGLMSWWLLRSAHSEYWEKHLLAILAPQAVKMKVIAADPIKFAKTTLSATHMTIEKLKFEAEFKAELIKVGGKDRDLDLLQAEDDLSNTYFEEKFFLRQHLGNIFEAILEILTNREKSGDEAETFEICSMIHRSGLGGVTNIITGLRNGSIVASSNLQHINFCCSIFDFLKANTTRIVDAEQSTASLSPEESLRDHVTVHMTYNNGREGSKKDISDSKVRVYTMDNAVSLMVPLALINSTPAREVAILRDLTNMLADANDPIRQFAPPPRHFAIEYTISTKSWISKWQHNKKSMDPDIQKLYQSPLRRGVLPVGKHHHPPYDL